MNALTNYPASVSRSLSGITIFAAIKWPNQTFLALIRQVIFNPFCEGAVRRFTHGAWIPFLIGLV